MAGRSGRGLRGASQFGDRHFSEADGALDEGAAAEGRAPLRPRAPLEKVPVPFLREGLCGDVYLFHLGDVHGVVVVLGVVVGVAGAVDEA